MGELNSINSAQASPARRTIQCGSPAEALSYIEKFISDKQLNNALDLADQAVRVWPTHEPLLVTAANLAKSVGRTTAALQLFDRAVNLGSQSAALERQAMIDEAAPYWHFRMMNDEVRNQAYDRALQHHVGSDSVVLDIGCGAGLLSMMAARAGAKHVYACEVHELMYHQAKKIFSLNGFDQKITTLNKVSNSLIVGRDLPEKADIIVAEVFDTGLLGEQALRTFAHARQHLLKPGGIILPAKASVQAVLIDSDLLYKEAVADECCGFKVAHMNQLTPSYFQARLDAFPHTILSEEQTVCQFDFQAENENKKTKIVEFEATKAGLCHAVCFWFTLDFGHDNEMSTGPQNQWNCWMQAVSTFDAPVSVQQGQLLRLELGQTSNRIYFGSPLG